MKKITPLLLLLTLMLGMLPPNSKASASVDQETNGADQRTILNFNNNWGFHLGDLTGAEAPTFDDSKFANITIPHTMRLEKKHANGGQSVYQGIGWYRNYFTVDEQYRGKIINIDFEGVQTDSDVYLNGEKVFTRNGGYVGFSVDITNKVKYGQTNVLAVRVSSFDSPDTPPGKPLANLDFHYFGGLYRDVKMRITNNLHISDALQADKTASGGVFVTYPEVTSSSATVNVKTHVVNANDVSAQAKVISKLVDKNGNVVAQGETDPTSIAASGDYQFNQNLTVNNPSLWSPDSPYLYSLVSEVYKDSSLVDSTTTKVGVRTIEFKPDGFYINGQKLFIRGANRHQQYQNIGDAASNSMQYRDALQMKENGFNAVRAAHYPNDPAFMDAADEIGLLVVECQPGWQNFTNNTTFYDLSLRDTREMIRRDRNRPSVVLWEAALNETITTAAWNDAVTKIAHLEYPGNQMYTANDYGLNGSYYDVNYKVVDNGGVSDPSKGKDLNPNKPFFTREWGDWGNGSRALRYQGEAAITSALLSRQKMLNGAGYPDWGGLDANARIGGYFLWLWNDHTRGSSSVTAGAGTVDIDRYEKYNFYWLQSMQSARNPVYGPMVFIGSTYSSTSSLNVNVFSNADSVKLYQNNVLVKEITRAEAGADVPYTVAKGGSPIFKFTLSQFVAGELRAEAILDGQVVKTHTVKTPGQGKRIEIEVRDRGIKPVADGSDLIPVYFKVVDANGTIVPSEIHSVNIAVTGQGQLVGKGMPRIGVEDQTVEAGIGFAFVRASDISGNIQITATSDGLTSATTTVSTLPYQGQFVSAAQHTPWVGGVEKFEPKESFYKNIAVGKPTTASSEQSGNFARNAVDNKDSTRWVANGSSLPQWLQVDLGKNFSLTGFQMQWEKSNAVYKYYIEVSKDGVNWTKVIDKSTNTSINGSNETALVDTRGRYVRLSIVGSITNNYWASLYEFKVIPSDEQIPDDIITDNAIDTITASSEIEDGRGTDKLRDGDTNIGTGWLAKSNEMPQSVTVKFKTPQTVAGSRIYWEKDSSWYTYDLEVSTDGVVWRKAIDNYQVGGQQFTPEAFDKPYKNINYVRVTIKDIIAGGGFRVGFAELILYGHDYTIPSDYGITAIKPLTIKTNQGIAPSLPTKITAVYNDESEQAVAVIWGHIEAASYANAGVFNVQGTVSGTSIKATAQVTVEPTVVPQTVITGAEKVLSDQTYTLTMGLANVTQSVFQQVYAQDLTLRYDPLKLEFNSVTSLKEGFQVIEQKETAPGQLRIVAASVGVNVPAQGDLLTIKLTAKSISQATNTTIAVDHVVIANGQGNELQVAGASREIQITVPTVPVDKSLLNATIASAQAMYDAAVEGDGDGQYAMGSKAQLQSAIDAAKAAVNDSNATQQQVDSAKSALEAAVQVFESKKITSDVNGGGVSIGDLAVVAAAYGKHPGQAGWNEKADVNHDGKVDIVDLAIVAKAILQ